MKFSGPKLLSFFGIGVRLVLTLLVVLLFLAAYYAMERVHELYLQSRANLQNQTVYVGNKPAPADKAPVEHPFWPRFANASEPKIEGATINGTPMVVEESETSSAPSDVCSYYRKEMLGWGWSDVTEETLGLKSNGSVQDAAVKSAEDQRYVERYRNTLDSNLVLRRERWSFHLLADPDKLGNGRTLVTILAVGQPTLGEMLEALGGANGSGSSRSGRPFEAVQNDGKNTYHTVFRVTAAIPEKAFQDAITGAVAEGWRPAFYLPNKDSKGGYFAWLVRSHGYASLSVKRSSVGEGTVVTLVEVTPESMAQK